MVHLLGTRSPANHNINPPIGQALPRNNPVLCAFPPGTFLVFPGVQQHSMGNYKELGGREAIAQLQEIVKKQSICMMVTATEEQPPHSRPMAVAEVDDRGVFWFLTVRTSEKFEELTRDPRISLYFANPGKQEYLAVHGHTTVSNDRARMKELFSPLAKAWVPEGAEDPDLRLLMVTPDESYYWDTKDGTVVAGVKILLALVGKTPGDDGGVEGPLKV